MMTPDDGDVPIALSIAGTDPSGAAGVNVDLQVFRDFDVHGLAAVSAIVAQNTQRVIGWDAVTPGQLEAQLQAVGEDFDADAVKIGMLAAGELVETTATWLESHRQTSVVLDPVMTSGTGQTSLTTESARTAFDRLIGVVDLITPNGPEARMLAGMDETAGPDELVDALRGRGWRRVLLKGGHLRGDTAGGVVDWYASGEEFVELTALEPVDADVRGTGCQLSSAIAAGRARGVDWYEAVVDARLYLHELLVGHARRAGRGRPMVVRTESAT